MGFWAGGLDLMFLSSLYVLNMTACSIIFLILDVITFTSFTLCYFGELNTFFKMPMVKSLSTTVTLDIHMLA